MTLRLRRGELAGLRWEDIHFEELTVMARRSVVDQWYCITFDNQTGCFPRFLPARAASVAIQPAAKRLGIIKRIGWHTFRRTYTTLLHANGEDVKVVQELLRHGSSRITMDVYAQAVTPAKRNAQGKVVAMLRETKKEEKLA